MMKTATTKTNTTESKQFPTAFFQDSEAHQTQPIHTKKESNMSRFGKILKATIAFSLLLPATFLLKPKAALAGGGFAQSCNYVRFYDANDPFLYAHCRRKDGTMNNGARINLDDYIINGHGQMYWQKNGGFSKSCLRDQFVNNDGSLYATCAIGDGHSFPSRIDLNQRILNDNGDLKYGGE